MEDERDLDLKSVDPQREEFNELIRDFVKDPLVLKAFVTVNRADFIESEERRNSAYKNKIIDLGEGSSISEPILVAQMMENLRLTGQEKVLEVGTASGYGAALLSICAKDVYTMEYNRNLAEKAKERLKKLNFDNVQVVIGDGALGIPGVLFDAIIITAACREFPPALVEQLTEGGRILAPIGKDPQSLELTLGRKLDGKLSYPDPKPITYCRFHPLISEEKGGFSKDYLEILFKMKKLLFELQAEEEGKTLEDFLHELQERRKAIPELQVLSDKAIIELASIPPKKFDFLLSLLSNLEALEEEMKRESTTTSEA